ncbi:MAG TPA: CopD family protein [Pseudonocardia sp.]|uniref:CopD family protein n=1 Tax=Pseudonocardia sp. TaxID=60912 RepID=UPI002CC89A88|nr:CopD family protein [Pseudonocardia sp.]HTF49693.1 CopD family protein [Pseudonocardia sp.]
MTGPLAGLLGAVLATWIAVWLTMSPPVPGVVLPPEAVRYGVPLARVLLDLALTATLGLSLLPMLLGQRDESALRRVFDTAYRAALVSAVTWLAAAVVSVALQTAEVAPVSGITAATLAAYVGDVSAAQGLLASAAVAVLAAVLAAVGIRFPGPLPARLLLITAGLGLLPLLVTGHAGELSARWHELTMVSLELHVYAATAWAGGLAATVGLLLAHPALLARALPRFSQLAGLCLAVVAGSGVLNALVELATTPGARLPSVLVTSHYGQLVLAKAGCLGALALLGGYVRFRVLPSVALGRRTALAGWVAGELAVLGVAFGLAVVLSRSGVLPSGD